ncbi:MAG: carbohydrate ABC transporter permease [Chloroflexota bacterium]
MTRPWRLVAYGGAAMLTLFMVLPIYLIVVAAFSSRAAIFDYPRPLVPAGVSLDSMSYFLGTYGVVPALVRSLTVGVLTVALSLMLGCPAGYAIARYSFPGRNLAQLLLVNVRAFPLAVLAIPLLVTFIEWHLYDTVVSVAFVHAAMSLPFTVLLSASVFMRVPIELEEAAMIMGTSRLGAVVRVVLPNCLPGLAAAALFAFVLSWNEVFAAAVLTQHSTTLPAQLVQALSNSPLPFKYAGGLALTLPAFIFIFFMRPFLFSAFRGVAGAR